MSLRKDIVRELGITAQGRARDDLMARPPQPCRSHPLGAALIFSLINTKGSLKRGNKSPEGGLKSV